MEASKEQSDASAFQRKYAKSSEHSHSVRKVPRSGETLSKHNRLSKQTLRHLNPERKKKSRSYLQVVEIDLVLLRSRPLLQPVEARGRICAQVDEAVRHKGRNGVDLQGVGPTSTLSTEDAYSHGLLEEHHLSSMSLVTEELL